MKGLRSDMLKCSKYDVVVVGSGVGGISAALGAARTGARTLLLERDDRVGGTGIHSPVGLICTYCDAEGNPINRGVYEEYVPYIYRPGAHHLCQTYDERELLERYEALLDGESDITVLTGTPFTGVDVKDGVVVALHTTAGTVRAEVFIDATAEGHLAAQCGAPFQKGRDCDGKMQPATLTFRVNNVDFSQFGLDVSDPEWLAWPKVKDMWEQLNPYYHRLKERNGTANPRDAVLCFPDRHGNSLLFNQTCIRDVDPTAEGSIEKGQVEGQNQVRDFWAAVRQHPAFANSGDIIVSTQLGVREGRRILGDYLLTAEDCLAEARYDDMVAACGYFVDIHDPDTGISTLTEIPNSGYYHIPYRSLCTQGLENLLVGSRCISGTHEAHASYRVMSSVSAIGQAAGVAAALAVTSGESKVRNVMPSWIRYILKEQNQFIEGMIEEPPSIESILAL